MSKDKIFEKINDEALGAIAGGMSRNLKAAVKGYDKVAKDVINGKYGNGSARVSALKAAGFDAQLVQDIVNGMLA